ASSVGNSKSAVGGGSVRRTGGVGASAKSMVNSGSAWIGASSADGPDCLVSQALGRKSDFACSVGGAGLSTGVVGSGSGASAINGSAASSATISITGSSSTGFGGSTAVTVVSTGGSGGGVGKSP